MNIIFIEDLVIKTRIGVYPKERKKLTKLLINVTLNTNLVNVKHSDNLADTVDYDQLAKLIFETSEQTSFKLLESLAECLSHNILNKFDVNWLEISLVKPNVIAKNTRAGVKIKRYADHAIPS